MIYEWCVSKIQNQWQICRDYIWWNASSCDHRTAVLNMCPCKWAILQDRTTISSSHIPINMHNGPIHKKWSGNRSTVLLLCTQHTNHIPPMVITSNLWILISAPTMQGSAVVMICPDKVTSSSLLQQVFHSIRWPQPAVQHQDIFTCPPHYGDHTMTVDVSLDKVNMNAVDISALDFCIWQHFSSNWTAIHIWK